MIPPPPTSTLFPYTTLSDLASSAKRETAPLRMSSSVGPPVSRSTRKLGFIAGGRPSITPSTRSEEHTSELQSHSDLVCRLLLEKKKKKENPKVNTTT